MSKRTTWRRPGLGVLSSALVVVVTGCQHAPRAATSAQPPVTDADRRVIQAARPIIALQPDAIWTEAFNQLVEIGPRAIDYLMQQPTMTRPTPPDDLEVLLCTSLVRLLAAPRSDPPALSAGCLETTLDVLHFDIKSGGAALGTIVIPPGTLPRHWHDLYPIDFRHDVAARIRLEADRQALRAWWQRCRDASIPYATTQPLRPRPEHLWRVLGRRYADCCDYEVGTSVVRCALPPRGSALFRFVSSDYNLVRATCVLLGRHEDPGIRDQLIELVADASLVVSYNARFALRFSDDKRIRELIEQHENRQLRPPTVRKVLW